MRDTNKFMPLVLGDHLRETARLTTEGHGAYLLLLMDFWVNGPPPDDDEELAQITRLPIRRWLDLRPRIARLFQIVEGRWRHERIEGELEKAARLVSNRAEAGKTGARARWGDGKGNGNRIGKGNGNRIAKPMDSAAPTHRPSHSQSQPESSTETETVTRERGSGPVSVGKLALVGAERLDPVLRCITHCGIRVETISEFAELSGEPKARIADSIVAIYDENGDEALHHAFAEVRKMGAEAKNKMAMLRVIARRFKMRKAM